MFWQAKKNNGVFVLESTNFKELVKYVNREGRVYFKPFAFELGHTCDIDILNPCYAYFSKGSHISVISN